MEHLEWNLHPALVHFPIALFVGAFLMESASLLWRKDTFERTAFHLYVLAVAMTPLAAGTGLWEAYEEHLHHPAVYLHRNLALAAVAIAPASVPLLWVLRGRNARYFRTWFMVFLCSMAVLITLTGYNGGRLVYEYGIGVESD
jgi:uncharacterized membrane protein